MTDDRANQQEREALRDALDHIMRVARQGVTPTRRLDWIATRAKYALEGKPWLPGTRDEPRDSAGRLGRDFAELRNDYAELELDRDYFRALVLGTWDNADELIATARRNWQANVRSAAK